MIGGLKWNSGFSTMEVTRIMKREALGIIARLKWEEEITHHYFSLKHLHFESNGKGLLYAKIL